jgi:hypothetical protein
MSILKNFDMDALIKARARNSVGAKDLEGELRQLAPEIEKLNTGETAKMKIPAGLDSRKFIMQITAKVSNLTPKGGAWEGRKFKIAGDGAEFVYCQRLADGKAEVRKRGGGGGRKPKAATTSTPTPTPASETNTDDKAIVREHK